MSDSDDKRPQPTMLHIAGIAGVSAMTVSRALRSDRSVAPATRERVMAVVNQLGYVPDQTAAGLSSKRTGFVALLVPTINNSNFADTARGLSDALAKAGLQILLGYTDYSLEREDELIEAMLRRRPEALVLTGGVHMPRARARLKSARIPVIEIWDLPEAPIDHVVGFSNAAATRAMVHHLAKTYRKIAFICGTSTADTRGSDRRLGFEMAIAEIGLPRDRVITHGTPPLSMDQGAEALGLLMARFPDTEAVICVSDLSAFGAMMECHRQNIRVPEDLAIAGFGDFEVAACAWPSITTVHIDGAGIGRLTGNLLLEALAARTRGAILPSARISVDFSIIQRESS